MYHSFLIHSSADGPLGCFHVLAVINSAVMNIGVHVSLSILVSNHVRNESPVYVQYRIQDAWGWCTGTIQRDDMG